MEQLTAAAEANTADDLVEVAEDDLVLMVKDDLVETK